MQEEPIVPPSTAPEPPPTALRRWQHLPPLTYILAVGVTLSLSWGLSKLLASQINLVFLTFLGILIAAILNYPVTFLSRIMPRALASLLTLLLVFGLFGLIVYLTIPTLSEQARHITEQLPRTVEQLENWYRSRVQRSGLSQVPQASELAQKASDELMKHAGELVQKALPVVSGVFSALSGVLLLFVLATFLAYEPKSYVEGLVRFAPKRFVPVMCELLGRLGETIQYWMLGTLAAMTLVGSLAAAGLALLGIESWLLLGVVMFFGEFIPYAGPLIASVPALALALADSPEKALYVGFLYLGIQQIEGYVVSPLVMKRAVSLHPALLLMWQIAMGSAFGFFGLLIATPLLACLKVTVEYLYIERMLEKPPSEDSPGNRDQDDKGHSSKKGRDDTHPARS